MVKDFLIKLKLTYFGWLVPGLLITIILSCSKSSTEPIIPIDNQPYNLSYGDSILYLKSQGDDVIVGPTEHRTGEYSGFPEGIEIDETTGAINLSKSETGLRYLVTFISDKGDTATTTVVISGITFKDQFYYLSQGDSIAAPVYNASATNQLPISGSSFDEGNLANSGGCSIKTTNGQINLAQTVRNGVFGNDPANDAKKEFDIEYRLNDKSSKSLNKIRVKVYYYATINDVAPDLLQILQERQQDGVFIGGRVAGPANLSAAKVTKAAKPRPPCIIAIGK